MQRAPNCSCFAGAAVNGKPKRQLQVCTTAAAATTTSDKETQQQQQQRRRWIKTTTLALNGKQASGLA